MMKDKESSKRYWLKVALTPEQKKLAFSIFGPKRHVSARIREMILNPYSRRNPDQWKKFVSAVTAIESSLERNLKAMTPDSPAAMCDLIQACYAATKLLEELRRHEP
jgi:hypothetical protein